MVNKILKVGDSAAVTLPKKTLKVLGINLGDQVVVNFQPRQKAIIIQPLSEDYQTRDYTKKEIDEFLATDKLDPKTARFVKKLLARKKL